ncbi:MULTISPECIES: hypothetical protein [Enterobacterales]|nr:MULTISPECIES: hypothetical protein [Enterobacterales]WPF03816.1 hypothetical protein SB028_16910 [Proteus vulgaris]
MARLMLVLEKCNTDKKAVAEILALKNQRNSNELDHKRKSIKEL